MSHAYRAAVLAVNLEAEYARIESRGVPAIKNLIQAGQLNTEGQDAVVAFLDMHLQRGAYADQAKQRLPVAVATVMHSGSVEMKDMTLGDRLTLDRDLNADSLQLSKAGIVDWPWRVIEVGHNGLVTGDGAVIPYGPDARTLHSVLFPLSPDKLLLIGDPPVEMVKHANIAVVQRSRRWIVAKTDSFFARDLRFGN